MKLENLNNKKELSIYIHYPFCKSKCPYCNFNSYCNISIDEDNLINGYIKEIEYYSNIIRNRDIKTIYFGGGTPSLMSMKMLSSLMNKISSISNIANNCEITLEANPNSISLEKLNNFHKIGINRLSIGVQSLHDKDLKILGRIHNRNEVIEAIKNAQNIFNDRYSIDLIFTRPNQELDEWKNELKEATELSPFHLSLYQLIIENGTQFYKNKIKIPDDDLSVDFYNITREILEKNNINFYEISNYSKIGYESKHNMNYWNSGEWIGIGAGAHGRLNSPKKIEKRYAMQNIKNPIKWLEKCMNKGNGISIKNSLTKEEIIEEFVIMGLRIKDGINIENIKNNVNSESLYEILNEKNINLLVKNNLIEANEKNIKIKKDGFLLLNSIIEKILL